MEYYRESETSILERSETNSGEYFHIRILKVPLDYRARQNFDRTRFQTNETLREFANRWKNFSLTPTRRLASKVDEKFCSPSFSTFLLRSARASLRYRPPRAKKRSILQRRVPSRRIRNQAENTVGDNEETAKRRVFRRPGNSLLFG